VKKIVLLMAMLMPVLLGVGIYSWWENANKPIGEKAAGVASIIDMGDYRLFEPVKAINPFSLNDGKINNHTLQGKWTFVMFGYTHCPDVCPTTLTRIKGIYKKLKASANVQILFVSADPLRDDTERLTKYVGYFDPEFIGATTSHDKLFPFAQNLLLPYGIIAEQVSENYAVSHSASIALINPQGRLHAHFKPRHQLGEVPIVDMKVMAQSFSEIVTN